MIRWVVRIFVGLVVLVMGAVAVLFMLPADRIAKVVTDQFEAATGRAMTLQGDVRPTLWPELGVNTGPVTIANADWSPSGPMLTAQSLSIGVDMGALFGGTIHVKRIEAEAPKIILEVARDGRANWDLGGGSAPAANGAGASDSTGLPEFALDRATVSGASVTFIDYGSGARTELDQIDASLSLQRTELNRASLHRYLLQFPWMTGKTVAAIYWQALRLLLKRIPLFTHRAAEGDFRVARPASKEVPHEKL